jgi:hypothetical protein
MWRCARCARQKQPVVKWLLVKGEIHFEEVEMSRSVFTFVTRGGRLVVAVLLSTMVLAVLSHANATAQQDADWAPRAREVYIYQGQCRQEGEGVRRVDAPCQINLIRIDVRGAGRQFAVAWSAALPSDARLEAFVGTLDGSTFLVEEKKPQFARSGKGILTAQEIDITVNETLERGPNAGQVRVFHYKGTFLSKQVGRTPATVVSGNKGGNPSLSGKAAAPSLGESGMKFQGECRQTLNGKVTADGPCTISVRCSSRDLITGEQLAGTDVLCYINADGRGYQPEPVIRKSGETLALEKAIESPYEGTANVSARGALREDGINATVTKTFVDGPRKGQVLVTTYVGKSERKLQ